MNSLAIALMALATATLAAAPAFPLKPAASVR